VIAREPNAGLIVLADVSTVNYREGVIGLAARYRLPAVYPERIFATSGGLLSYGSNVSDIFRRAAGYVDRILKGEKAGDLPVQAPTKYELVVNLNRRHLCRDRAQLQHLDADCGGSFWRNRWRQPRLLAWTKIRLRVPAKIR
jgi:hypothetical protein